MSPPCDLEAPSGVLQNWLIRPRQFAFVLVSLELMSLLLATLEHRRNIRALGAQYSGNQRSLAVLLAALNLNSWHPCPNRDDFSAIELNAVAAPAQIE